MKNKFLIFIALAGMISFFACEKDETRAILSANPVAPVIESVSDLVLAKDNASDSVIISGSKADFGYNASIVYILEAAVEGTDFVEPIELGQTEVENEFGFTQSSLNTLLITVLPEDEQASLELRVRAVIVSSTTGGSDQIESTSAALAVKITTYGPPSLYLTDDAHSQRLVSANDDGVYSGWVYTDGTAFTLTNKVDGKVYGVTDGVVVENGDPLEYELGAYDITVNLNDGTIESKFAGWSVIGTVTPPDYDFTNDVNMVYNFDNTWTVTGDFHAGNYKYRKDHNWDLNYGDSTPGDGILDEPGGVGNDIPLDSDGNYTLAIDLNTLTYKITKN